MLPLRQGERQEPAGAESRAVTERPRRAGTPGPFMSVRVGLRERVALRQLVAPWELVAYPRSNVLARANATMATPAPTIHAMQRATAGTQPTMPTRARTLAVALRQPIVWAACARAPLSPTEPIAGRIAAWA